MPSRPRQEAAGAIHHVVAQGNGRTRIVMDDRDRREYTRRFLGIAAEHGWSIHASSLLDTHHHAVVETPEPTLARGMQRILGGYAWLFNERHGREGHLFHGPFWSRRIADDAHFFTACLYVVLNPVAAGLCSHPREWRWSSYRATVAGRATERLSAMFGREPGERYADIVEAATARLLERRARSSRELWDVVDSTRPGRLSGSG